MSARADLEAFLSQRAGMWVPVQEHDPAYWLCEQLDALREQVAINREAMKAMIAVWGPLAKRVNDATEELERVLKGETP